MISVFLYSHEKRELSVFSKIGREIVGRLSDDDWDFLGYSNKKLVFDFLKSNPIIHMSCIDVIDENGVAMAERLRQCNSGMYIILLTDATVSPVMYIRPTIMAGSLLLRPLSPDCIKKVFTEAVTEFLKKSEEKQGESFVIENRDGRQLVPYNRIVFFESREKKIYLCAGSKEYSFYDTLDNLEQNLPEGFMRCHRSFIVARSSIKKIILSQNTIILEDGYRVPLSRSYKSVFKELK